MRKFLTDFLSNESGATAIEYGLIATGIAIAIVSAVQAVGGSLTATFTNVSTGINP